MKRFYKLFPICMILILLICSNAFAETCGQNITYTNTTTVEDGDTIRFKRTDSNKDAIWDKTGCGNLFKTSQSIKYVWFDDVIGISSSRTFDSFQYVEEMHLPNVILSGNAISGSNQLQNFFRKCYKLRILDLRGWNTSTVTNMDSMFSNCSSLEELNLSGWDTSSVVNPISTFYNCSSLKILTLGGKTINVNNNIFSTLPAEIKNKDWQKTDDPNAGMVLKGGKLFTEFNSETMPGKWTTDIKVATPEITTQPQSLTLTYGYNFGSLSVAAKISDGSTLSYQWYSNTVNSTEGASLVANATQPTYTYPLGESVSPAKYYYCVVTSVTGTTATSNIVPVTIGQKPVTLDGTLKAENKTYDNLPAASFSGVTLNGIISGDDVSLTITGHFDSPDVGSDKPVTIDSYGLTGTDAGNYELPPQPSDWNSLTANITPAGISEVVITIVEPEGTKELPKTAASSPENITSCTVSWDSEGIAAYNTDYTAVFTVKTDRNHIFDEHTAAKVNGQDVASGDVILNLDGTLTVSYKFHTAPETGWCASNTIQWTKDGNTISFKNDRDDETRTWQDSCGEVFKNDPNITTVWIDQPILINFQDKFRDFKYVEEMHLSKFIPDRKSLTSEYLMTNAFSGCVNLKIFDASGMDVSQVTGMYEAFKGCTALETLDLSGWNTASLTRTSSMFENCTNLQTVDLSGWDTSNIRDMGSMFSGCENFNKAILDSNWNTSGVKDMSYMFSGCKNLTDSTLADFNLSGQNTAALTNATGMFKDCIGLKSPDVSGWNTSNLQDADHMFNGCSALQSLDVSRWNTSNLQNTIHMFDGCSSLSSLDVSQWNTSKITSISDMFLNCSSLTELDISGWDTSNIGMYANTFEGTGISTLTLGEKSFEQSIYSSATSPNFSSPWVYIAKGASAESSLPIGTVKVGYEFLHHDGYDYKQMAGTWTANTVTVTFDPNKGSGSMASQTVGVNIETALNKNDSYITREGYSFNGWNTQANGGGTPYADGEIITISDALVLYAQWTPNTFTVSFDANQPAGAPDPAEGEMTPQNFTYDVEQQLSKNNFKLTGYQFAGWNTKADGKGTSYPDKQSVKNLTAKAGDNVTLYGQWNPIDYTITITTPDNNGTVTARPAGTADAPVHYGDKVTLTIDPNEGYVLDTLEIKSSGGETVTYDAEAGTFTMPADNVTVSAAFKKHVHEYSYSASGNVLTAECADIDGGHVGNKTAELTLNGPENLVYDGSAKSASVTGEIPGVDTPSVIYLQDGSVIGVAPVNAGNYTAQITLGEATAKIDFTIGKATPEVEVPTASPIKNGQALFDSQLTGGSAVIGGTPVRGSFAWKDPSIRPELSDSQTTDYEAVFIPEDTVNYNPVVIRLKLTVGVVYKAAVKFTVVNGAWVGGSDDEINVTLECGEGEVLKLSADQIPVPGEPAAGFKAGSWDVAPSAETVITGDTTYTYTFLAQDQFSHTVTFKVVNGYWDDGSSAAKTVTLTGYVGEELKLKAEDILAAAAGSKPGAGYRTGSWDAAPSTETAVTEDTVYTYSYEPVTYTVNVTTEGEGTAVPSVTSGPIGTEVTLTASPNEGYSFKGWDVITGGVTISGDNFTIGTDNVVIKAVFEADQPESAGTVSVVKEGEGDAVANPSSNVKAGETVTLIAVPAEGYKFINWVVVSGGVTPDDVTAPVTAFSMGGENVQVKAVFESEGDKPFHGKVSVSTEGEGNAAANPASDVESGERVTLLAIPASGNRFVRWEVESGEVTPKDEESVSTAFIMENRDVSVKAVFAVGPEDDREAAAVIEEPKAAEELTEQDEPQDLLASPGKAEGGTMMYSLDGVDFSKKIPQEKEEGTYTVYWYVKGDADHKDTEVSEMTVTIGERVDPMDLTVEFVNLKNNGSKGVPDEFDSMELDPVITISSGSVKSKSKAVKLVLSPGIAMLTDTVRFNKKIEDLGPGKYTVSVSGLPKVFYSTDQIYSSDEPVAGPVLWKYELSANAEINMKDSTAIIRVYLFWDNGSRPEEIRVVALPEDEIGAYKLNEDGSKEYLLFHTYDLCMAWLGNDDLCRGYERCFHKEF